jgi:hypothetical protein
MVAFSAVIPAVFLLRLLTFERNETDSDSTRRFRLRIRSSRPSVGTSQLGPHDGLLSESELSPAFAQYIAFLESVDYSITNNILDSDVVELHHCNITHNTAINWTDFLVQADPLVQSTVTALQQSVSNALVASATTTSAVGGNSAIDSTATTEAMTTNVDSMVQHVLKEMTEEFLLELLEQYLNIHGHCDYSKYRPSVVGHKSQGDQLVQQQQQQSAMAPVHRLVFVISAFRDVTHLTMLLEAIHQPQHYIVIHLDRHCFADYQARVEELITTQPLYRNVVVVQFGAVIYQTDTLSLVNLRILQWLTVDLRLNYDHAVLLDGSAFPLYSALELVATLRQPLYQTRSVWLGELTTKGQRESASCGGTSQTMTKPMQPADHLLTRKRLLFTRQSAVANAAAVAGLKLNKRLPPNTWQGSTDPSSSTDSSTGSASTIPNDIRNHLMYKSTSGNQGMYSRYVVQQLLNSNQVMQLFALSKYGCCCCLEERNWIAALSMIGYACEALAHTSMFQAWGGQSVECEGSMKNAVLTTNSTVCFRSENPSLHELNVTDKTGYFRGQSMWDMMVEAKRQGVVFARKFDSDNVDSVQLRQKIQSQLWQSPAR